MALRLDFLGGFKLDGDTVGPQVLGRKTIGALAALALSPGGILTRSALAGLLWSDRGEEQARDSLRQALASLRRAVASHDPSPIEADRDQITLRLDRCVVDIHLFQARAGETSREAKAEAAALYRGPLLDGLSINDAAFQDWLVRERSRIDTLAASTLEWLLFSSGADPAEDTYLIWSDSLARIDDLSEPAARARMLHFGARNETGKAAREYERLKAALRDDLNVSPSQETVRTFETVTATGDAPDPVRSRAATVTPIMVPATPANTAVAQPLQTSTDHPRIAVLPLRNLSGNPDENFFVDGVTEDIIVSLSSFRAIRVISSQSSFGFRASVPEPVSVARTLNASYLVSGSLRRSPERVRINVELIAGDTGENVWATRFDRELKDIFDIQESISRSIVTVVVGQIERTAVAQQRRKATDDLSAYELVLRGNEKLHQVRWHDNIQARDFYRSALTLDPQFARAHAGMALAAFDSVFMGWDTDELLPDGVGHAVRAAELDPIDGHAQLALGMLKLLQGDYAAAEFHLQSAHRLNESDADIMIYFAIFLIYNGEPETALRWIDEAVALNPLHPEYYFTVKGTAHVGAGEYDAALDAYSRRGKHDRLVLAYMAVAANLADRPEEQTALLTELRQTDAGLPQEGKRLATVLLDEIQLYRHAQDRDKLTATFGSLGLLAKNVSH